jgi:hypothetical protein
MRGLFKDNYPYGYGPSYINPPHAVETAAMMPLGTRTFEDENAAWRQTHPCPLPNNGLGQGFYHTPWAPHLMYLKVFLQCGRIPPQQVRVPCSHFAHAVHAALGCPKTARLPLLAQWDILIALANEAPTPWGAQVITDTFNEAGCRYLRQISIKGLPPIPVQRH